jgi:hypothetical protein
VTREPGRADVALAGAGVLAVAAWVVAGFVDRDGDVRLALSVALLALGAVLLVRLRRFEAVVFVLCGVAGLADRAGAGTVGTLLGWLTFGVGVAVVVRSLGDKSAPRV